MNSPMPYSFRFVLLSVPLFLLTGCMEKPQIRQYTVTPESGRIVTTEAVRGQFPVIPFRYSVPSSWRKAVNDQFSVIAWSAGPKDPKSEARITLSDLPPAAGLEAQIARWRGQIDLPTVEASELMKQVQTLKLGDASGSWIELTGPTETILGLIISRPDKMWIVKYRSSRATAEQQKKTFREFCESFRIETAVGG